jgi:hypothetical protein
MSLSLKKMWLTMDISTSARRVQLTHNEKFWTDVDIYNILMFVVKLDMRFNDPIEGPGDDGLRKIILGQRSLTPLCMLLKRTAFTSIMDVMKLGIRYTYRPKPRQRHLPMFGIPPQEIGVGHLEGWGAGRVHLYRPDELMIKESARRKLGLERHIMPMMIWGYMDRTTGKAIKVTEEEMYMSDDEVPKSSVDVRDEDQEMKDGDEIRDGRRSYTVRMVR